MQVCIDIEDNQWKNIYSHLTSEMTQQVKVLASKPGNPSSIPRPLAVEGEN